MAQCPFPIRIKNPRPSFLNPNFYLDVPCGKCSVCEYNRKQEWIIRLVHESMASQYSFFVTLTYSDEYVPICPDCGKPYLCKADAMDFVNNAKRFFKFYGYNFRYFIVGEYGETYGRPHFHLLCFLNHLTETDINELELTKQQFTKAIEMLWKYGFVYCGGASDGSAAYCAKYCVKNIPCTADRCTCINGYVSSSRKPIIGFSYLSSNEDYFKSHPEVMSIRVNSYRFPIPRSYRKKLIENDEVYRFASAYTRAKFANEKSRKNDYGVDSDGRPLPDGGLSRRQATERHYRRRMHKRGSDRQ